jgi:chorismate mutase
MPDMRVRGIRGATTAEANTREAILAATDELLRLMIEANQLCAEDVASVIFTTSSDLNADYPALAARALGWHDVALMCAHEMNVLHGVPLCIRILMHWNTPLPAREVQHVYIKGAARLRPDRTFTLHQA